MNHFQAQRRNLEDALSQYTAVQDGHQIADVSPEFREIVVNLRKAIEELDAMEKLHAKQLRDANRLDNPKPVATPRKRRR